MSVAKLNTLQIGQSGTAANNFCWSQPSTPDGTVRLGNGNAGSATDILIATSSGNLGLGVTPSAWGSTYKAFQLGAQGSLAKNSGLELITLGLNYYRDASDITKYIASAAATQYTQYNGQHIWFTAPSGTAGNAISFTQAMTLDASGNLLVGTTSGSTHVLTRNESGNYSTQIINQSGTAPYCLALSLTGVTGGTGAYFLVCADNANRLLVAGNGNVQNTNNSYGAISDQSIKENIVDATPKLQDLLAVKIRNFNLKGDTTKQIGVVAQELEEVFPGMIEENSDGLKGVKYSVFVPMLVKAIQELSAQVTTLQAEINALKA